MLTYCYDGTFEGLLTVLWETKSSSEAIADITTPDRLEPDLFTKVVTVETQPELAAGLTGEIEQTLSRKILMDIALCFITEIPGVEKTIAEYLRLLLRQGPNADGNYAEKTVRQIHQTRNKVTHEVHRLHAFVRFRQLAGGIFYAPIEPEYNVVRFLEPHFTARFADQSWVIHDIRRNAAIYYDGSKCEYLPQLEALSELVAASGQYQPGLKTTLFAQEEARYQELWNNYFKEIAIAERKNPKLQRQRMPARYWRFLVENVQG